MEDNENMNQENSQLDPVLERLQQLFPDADTQTLTEGFESIMKAHPEIDMLELSTDALFAQFAAGRTDTLDAVYETYSDFVSAMNREIQRQVDARTGRATYGANARTGGPQAGFTQAQREMLNAWNETYPEYAMTGREYINMLKNA